MNWKKIICWLRGHEYMVIAVLHHHPVKKEFLYQCTRCGSRVRYSNAADELSEHITKSHVVKSLSKGL